MNWDIFLENSYRAEWVLNISLQVLIVSFLGWVIIRIWKPGSAPVKGGCNLALLISIAATPLFSIVFHMHNIAWFQASIPSEKTYYVNKMEDTGFPYRPREPLVVKEKNGT